MILKRIFQVSADWRYETTMTSHPISAVNIHYRKLWRNIRYQVSTGLIQESWYVPYVALEVERHYLQILVHPCRMDLYNIPRDAVSQVSRKKIMHYTVADEKYHVAAVDCGMKQNIVRNLNQRGGSVTVFPWNTSAREVEKLRPDGIFYPMDREILQMCRRL